MPGHWWRPIAPNSPRRWKAPLEAIRARHNGRRERRVDMCLETLMGTRTPYYSQPTWMYMPELPAIEFFERSDFPWLDAFEAQTEAMRKELLQVLVADREGLQAYIDYPADMPLDQFRELNRSRRWSAYFLWNQSVAHAQSPGPLPGDLPVAGERAALFYRRSGTDRILLRPRRQHQNPRACGGDQHALHGARAPDHSAGLRFPGRLDHPRMGSGQAWVFDDTINHEAWNLSDTPRAILIFDVWNPLLTAAERDMITTATEIYAKYYSLPAGQGL